MRFYAVLLAVGFVLAGLYWIWSDVDGLSLIEVTSKESAHLHAYKWSGEKPLFEFGFNWIASNQGIYKYLAIPFMLFALVGFFVGVFAGYAMREPLDEHDTTKIKQQALQAVEEAQARANTAETRAKKTAETMLEEQRAQLAYKLEQAETERRAAIQAQQDAEAAIRKAQIERADALRVADNATRKKNAAYAAAERFKKKAVKTA